ncbi:MAG: glycosyl transferase family 4 [DPANN group archaeon]|nr:glycosyl transferase family 4 [DPANN group archaeon]
MVNYNIILASTILIATFVATLFLVKGWIKVAKVFGLVGKDMNKWQGKDVAESGGVAIIFSFIFGLFVFIFLKTFLLHTETHFIELLAITLTVLLAGFLGFIDGILGWKKGLKQWQKVLFTIPIALPLVVLNAGHSTINIPFLGIVNLGLLYPLVMVPVAIVGAANGYNLLAGYNGLEAGLGTVILGALGVTAYLTGSTWLALVAFIAVAALLAFLLFNWYPSRVFPGDSMTYSIGALIAVIAILGSMEKLALFLFIPYFLDILLYFRARVIDRAGDVQAFAKPNKDGTIEMPYSKIYDSTHAAIWLQKKIFGKATEKGVVYIVLAAEIILAGIGILLV